MDWADGTCGKGQGKKRTPERRERQLEGVCQPRGPPPSSPRRVGWLRPATSVGDTGPTCRLLGQLSVKLLQYHAVDDVVDVAFVSQQPFAALVPELLGHHKGSAAS